MNLFTRVEQALTDIGHGWTDVEQAHTMASAVMALRPDVSVEIGVYAGKGLITLGLAHLEVGRGMVYGIDPYSPDASSEGQLNPEDKKFWSTLNHDEIYNMCEANINRFGVRSCVRLIRKKSDEFEPPDRIGVLRIDGNHGETVLRDVERYSPKVLPHGLLFLDDLSWTGGAVLRAAARLKTSGWREIFRLGDGAVFRRLV